MTLGGALRDIAWPVTLIGMNVVMYVALDGRLAWETHLGGFLAGAAIAAAFRPRPLGDTALFTQLSVKARINRGRAIYTGAVLRYKLHRPAALRQERLHSPEVS